MIVAANVEASMRTCKEIEMSAEWARYSQRRAENTGISLVASRRNENSLDHRISLLLIASCRQALQPICEVLWSMAKQSTGPPLQAMQCEETRINAAVAIQIAATPNASVISSPRSIATASDQAMVRKE
jgi:hypothetical protein